MKVVFAFCPRVVAVAVLLWHIAGATRARVMNHACRKKWFLGSDEFQNGRTAIIDTCWYLLDTETAGCSSVFLSLFCISALSWHHRSILSSCSTARKVCDALLPCSLPPQVALLSMDFCIQTLDFDSPVLGSNYLGTPSKTITGNCFWVILRWFKSYFLGEIPK